MTADKVSAVLTAAGLSVEPAALERAVATSKKMDEDPSLGKAVLAKALASAETAQPAPAEAATDEPVEDLDFDLFGADDSADEAEASGDEEEEQGDLNFDELFG